MTSSLTPGREETILSGNAHVDTGSLSIDADRIDLSGKGFRYVSCTGDVRVVDHKRGISLQADSLDYDRTHNIARFQGNITVRDPSHETLIKAGWLEYFRDEEKMLIQIGVRIIKKDIVCRSESATYDRTKDSLELMGLPKVIKGDDVYEAGRIRVNLKSEDIILDGGVQGTVIPQGSHS